MRDTRLSLKLQLFKGSLVDAFKKEKAVHKAKFVDQYLNAFKSLFILFYPKLSNQTISFMVVRCKSAYNCKDRYFFISAIH